MSELDVFGKVGATDTTATSAANAAATSRKEAMIASIKETVQNDPTYLEVKNSLSAGLVITKVLGFGDSGNIKRGEDVPATDKDGNPILDENGAQKMKKNLIPIPENVGYIVQNNTTQELQYTIEVFEKNAEGTFVGTPVTKILAPGKSAAFSRKWLTLFSSQAAVSNKFANGRLTRSSARAKGNLSPKEAYEAELEAYYVQFTEEGLTVNDDSLKEQIGKKVKGTDGKPMWVVKPEYNEIFGYLNNVPEKKVGGKKPGAAKPAFDSTDIYANYINKMAKEMGYLK